MPNKPSDTGDIRDNLSFKWVLLKQLDRIAQNISTVAESSRSEQVISSHERAVDMLEALLFPYLDPKYHDGVKKASEEAGAIAKKEDAVHSLTHRYHVVDWKLQELMKLLGDKGLLLEEETEGVIE